MDLVEFSISLNCTKITMYVKMAVKSYKNNLNNWDEWLGRTCKDHLEQSTFIQSKESIGCKNGLLSKVLEEKFFYLEIRVVVFKKSI